MAAVVHHAAEWRQHAWLQQECVAILVHVTYFIQCRQDFLCWSDANGILQDCCAALKHVLRALNMGSCWGTARRRTVLPGWPWWQGSRVHGWPRWLGSLCQSSPAPAVHTSCR